MAIALAFLVFVGGGKALDYFTTCDKVLIAQERIAEGTIETRTCKD